MGLAAVVSSTSSSATLHVWLATSKAPESSFSSAVGSAPSARSQPGSVSALLTAQPPEKTTCDQPECCPDRMVSTPLPL